MNPFVDVVKLAAFEAELKALINKHSIENGSNTPDWILASYLCSCLLNFNHSMFAREHYYGRIAPPVPPEECPQDNSDPSPPKPPQ